MKKIRKKKIFTEPLTPVPFTATFGCYTLDQHKKVLRDYGCSEDEIAHRTEGQRANEEKIKKAAKAKARKEKKDDEEFRMIHYIRPLEPGASPVPILELLGKKMLDPSTRDIFRAYGWSEEYIDYQMKRFALIAKKQMQKR